MKHSYTYLLLCVPCIAAALALLNFGYIFHLIFALSCIALVLLFPQQEFKSVVWLIAVAFFLSIGGDWMLKFKYTVPIRFVYGIGLYFLAHICYLLFFLKNGKMNITVLIVFLAGYGGFFCIEIGTCYFRNVPVNSCFPLSCYFMLYLSSCDRIKNK